MQSFIFDFNGTLFQDSILHFHAWQAFFASRGVDVTEDLFHQYMCGPPNDAILRRFLGEQLTNAEVQQLAKEKEELYRAAVLSDPSHQSLTDGAPEMLETLRERGIPYAIATGSDRENVDFYFDALNIGRWFAREQVFCAENRLPGKPDPTIYRLTMEKQGFAPEETLVVEDALPGIQSAIGAGVDRIIAIDTTLGPHGFDGIAQVIAVIHDFTGFSAFLD